MWPELATTAVVALLVLAGCAGGAESADSSDSLDSSNVFVFGRTPDYELLGVDKSGLPANPLDFYPGRRLVESNDHEAPFGVATSYDGWNIAVTRIETTVQASVTTVVVSYEIKNREGEREIAASDWKLVIATQDDSTLIAPAGGDRKELDRDKTTSGTVRFDMPTQSADLILIHDPPTSDSARGVWAVSAALSGGRLVIAAPSIVTTVSDAAAEAERTSEQASSDDNSVDAVPTVGPSTNQAPPTPAAPRPTPLPAPTPHNAGDPAEVFNAYSWYLNNAPFTNGILAQLPLNLTSSEVIASADLICQYAPGYSERWQFLDFVIQDTRATTGDLFIDNEIEILMDAALFARCPSEAARLGSWSGESGARAASSVDTPTSPVPAQSPTAPQPTAAPAQAVVMPDLICFDLQAAQDIMQALTGEFFAVESYDASGAGRFQINDSNWVVIEQSPAPGSPVGANPMIGAIKDDEALC